MSTLSRASLWRAASVVALSFVGGACTGIRGLESDQPAVLPTVFTSEAGDIIELYPTRLVIGGISYSAVDCSVAEYHCIAFDPIGAIVAPRRCDNYRTQEWSAGEFDVGIYSMVHHTPVLVTTHYTNFAYFFTNTQEGGVMAIFYDKKNGQNQNRIDNLVVDGHSYPQIRTRYDKTGGPAFLPCE